MAVVLVAALLALAPGLQATLLVGSDANVNFDAFTINAPPPVLPPVPGSVTHNVTDIGNTNQFQTVLVQSSLGDPVYGLNNQPVVLTRTNGTTFTYTAIYLSPTLASGTIPTSEGVLAEFDFVQTRSQYWGADFGFRRGAAGSYQSLLEIFAVNNGNDLMVLGHTSTTFPNVLALGTSTHVRVMFDLPSQSYSLSFSNILTTGSIAGLINHTNYVTELGYMVISHVSSGSDVIFGVDNILITNYVPEPSVPTLVFVGTFACFGYRQWRRHA
jgi:hypothetical protein